MCVCLSLPHVLPYLPISWVLVPPWTEDDLCFCVGKPMGCCLPIQPFLSPLLCSLLTSRAMRPGGGSGEVAGVSRRRDRSSGMRSGGSRPRTTSSGRGRGSGSGRGMARASGRLGPMTAGPAGGPGSHRRCAGLLQPSCCCHHSLFLLFQANPRPRPSSRGVAGSSCRQKEGMRARS